MRGVIGWAWAGTATLAEPLLRATLRRRVARGKEIAARLPERFGRETTPRPTGRLLWLHAASVGETMSLLPVIAQIQAIAPEVWLLLTSGTVTSARLVQERLSGDRLIHRFVPLDVPRWVGRFVDHWRPDAAAFVESELWPNLLFAARKRGVRLALVNGRLSARSAAGWRRAAGLAARVLGGFEIVLARTEEDAGRLRALGAANVAMWGDLKAAGADLPVDVGELTRLMALIGDRPVWAAVSTHPGEEAIAARIHRTQAERHRGLLTIIVPRHPDRGAEIAASLGGVMRRSRGEGPPDGGIWLIDTLGELGLVFRLSPVVFVGKSLTGEGGQNPLEPARLGCAIAVGPNTANFTDSVEHLRTAGALTIVADEDGLRGWVDAMLSHPCRRASAGRRARASAKADESLPQRVAARLVALLDGGT